MPRFEPFAGIRYNPDAVSLDAVVAPPYDVIGPEQRHQLEARSPYNVVHVDLPTGDEPYDSAARTLRQWTEAGIVVRDGQPALWALTQRYRMPD